MLRKGRHILFRQRHQSQMLSFFTGHDLQQATPCFFLQEVGTSHPSEVTKFHPSFNGVRVTRFLCV